MNQPEPTILFSTGEEAQVATLDAAFDLLFRNGDESSEQIAGPELDAGDENRGGEAEGELDEDRHDEAFFGNGL